MLEIVHILNVWLIAANLVGLALGVYRFRHLDMVGPWFRWKAGGYAIIMLLDFVSIYYGYKGDPLWLAVRLSCSRIVINIEMWYCMHYRFFAMGRHGHGERPGP